MMHPLDRPIWNALISAQRALAEGGDLAKRYPADIGPFAETREPTSAAYAELLALIPPEGAVALFTIEPISPPPTLKMLRTATVFQMVAPHASIGTAIDPSILELGEADADEMLALAELTKPGPFARRTRTLGRYIGIRIDGRLVAMAGERMRLDAHVELSAVCVHPDHRGKGYARLLLTVMMASAAAQGIVPFLHVFEANTGAIALYRDLGFDIRQRFHLAVVGRAG